MGRSIFQQETQVRQSLAADRLTNVAASEANYNTNPASLLDDLNVLRSLGHLLLKNQAGNWYDGLNTPATLETGSARGVNDLNTDLHAVEKKRFLQRTLIHVDVTVTAAQNYEILLLAELPTNTTIAVGAVTTLGTVAAAHGGTFGTHSLTTVAGVTFTDPANLCEIVDSVTHDPILSGGQRIWGLIHSENASDGHTATGTTPNRLQISFVRLNAGGTAYEAVPAGDIAGQTIHYFCRERVRFEDLVEGAFISGGEIDLPAGSTVDRQTAYNGQGTTPVDLTTNATLDLEGAGLIWAIRDDLEADLFRVVEGSAGGTSAVNIAAAVDTFDVDAVTNDFLNGASFDTGAAGTTINVGVTANQIDSGGALTVASAAASILRLDAGGSLEFGDTNEAGSTWATPLVLSDSSAEWDLAETNFGEVSLLAMINAAYASSLQRTRVWSVATANVAVDTDVSGPSGDNNFDTDFGALDGGTFVDDYDFYLNGQYLRPGANAAANHDVYPGTSLAGAGAQLKFEFKLKIGDQLAIVKYV